VDLEGFEGVSARHGTDTGDLLLYEVASRLREKVGEHDIVMRSGDAQFAIFVPAVEIIETAEALAEALIERLESSMTVAGTRFRLTASIGITLFPQHGDEWRFILHSADAAAYDARTLGRGRISISIPPPKPR
jgi:diguanylate cyclase (GGDEF)-like protein